MTGRVIPRAAQISFAWLLVLNCCSMMNPDCPERQLQSGMRPQKAVFLINWLFPPSTECMKKVTYLWHSHVPCKPSCTKEKRDFVQKKADNQELLHLFFISTGCLLPMNAAVWVVSLLEGSTWVTGGTVCTPQVVAAALKTLPKREWLVCRAWYKLWKGLQIKL